MLPKHVRYQAALHPDAPPQATNAILPDYDRFVKQFNFSVRGGYFMPQPRRIWKYPGPPLDFGGGRNVLMVSYGNNMKHHFLSRQHRISPITLDFSTIVFSIDNRHKTFAVFENILH